MFLGGLAVFTVVPRNFDFSRSFLENAGDPALYAITWRWQWHALTQGFIRNFWHGWFFYPNRWVMGYTEHILGLMPLYKLYERLFSSAPAASTAVVISLFVVCGWAGYAVGKRIGKSVGAGVACAVVASFSTFHFNQISHVHVSAYFTIPLTLLALERFLERPRLRQAVGFGVFWGIAPLFSYSNWAAASVAIPAFVLVWVGVRWFRGRHLGAGSRSVAERIWGGAATGQAVGGPGSAAGTKPPTVVRALGLGAVAVGVCLALVVPMSLQFVAARSEVEVNRSPTEIVHYSVKGADLFRPAERSVAYMYLPAPFGKNPNIETLSYFGLSGFLLGLYGFIWPLARMLWGTASRWARKRGSREEERPPRVGGGNRKEILVELDRDLVTRLVPWFAAALVGFAMMFGPEVRIVAGWRTLPGPYRLLMGVPGFSQLRAAGRFSVLVFLFAAVCAAAAWARAAARARGWQVLVALACALWVWEGMIHTVASAPLPKDFSEVPPHVRWLAAAERGPVVELPIYEPGSLASAYAEVTRLYLSSFDWQPRVNGYSGYEPRDYEATVASLSSFPSEASIKTLREIGVRYVVVDFAALARYRRGGAEAAFDRSPLPDLSEDVAELKAMTDARAELTERADFAEIVVYELNP